MSSRQRRDAAMPKNNDPKPDKIGPEDLLVEELRVVITGKRPATEEWKKDHRGAAYLDGSGSANWGPVEAAVKYALEPDSIRQWLAETFFPLMRSRFMVSEVMSLIYGSMHLAAFASIAATAETLGDAAILGEARACTRLYLSVLAQRECPDGRILVAGCRSAGHAAWEHGDPWGRWCLSLATGKGERDAFAGLKAAGEGPAKAWQSSVFLAFADQLGAALPSAQSSPASLGFRAMTDLHVARCSEGVATWIGCNVNANTKPEMLSVWRDGKIASLPGPGLAAAGGKRVNRGWMDARCGLGVGALIGHMDGVPFEVALPGEVRSMMTIEGPEADAPPAPVEPPPLPGPNIEALVAEVATLGAQPEDSAVAVAFLRARDWFAASRAVFQLMVPQRSRRAAVELSDRLAAMARFKL